MKERQIPFKAPMVRALLAGTKTQTRRVVKQTLERLGDGDWYAFDHKGINYRVNARHMTVAAWANLLQFCPYGKPGDRLWVREAWRTILAADHMPPRDLSHAHRIWYEADAPHQPGEGKYRPSMFMPRWASRITLEIVGVRVERLQDISEADAIAEGINCYPFRPDDGFPICSGYTHEANDDRCMLWATAKLAYLKLWESINGPGSWEDNPWVWVVEFKRIDQ